MSDTIPIPPSANARKSALVQLPAPPHRPGRFWWIGFLFARLRFAVILAAIGLVIVKWDVLQGYYEKWVRPTGDAAGVDLDHEYFCPMHPSVVRDTNKEKCPICFMPLSKRKKGEDPDDPLPAGTVSRVQLTPYRVVLAGVRTVPVSYLPLTKQITTVGIVEFDERKLRTVSARVKGRIDTLFVNQTGQMIHEGDPLAKLYSPDLVVTVQNLIDARKAGNKDLEANARDRLKLWGIDDKQVNEIVMDGKPITHLTIRSPITGHVLKKFPREGQYVEEGGALFDVADLSVVWVQAQLYEDDLAFIPAGGHDPKTGKPAIDLPVTAFTRAFPNRAFGGTLSFLFPHVDTETRTLTIRFDLPNPDHELRPGMTATVTLRLTPDLLARTPAGTGLFVRDSKILAVPESAVIDTGLLKVVYRESLPNTFEGVKVELGAKLYTADGAVYYPVLSGVNEGDQVVAAGSFLLDAETRLNPAMGSIYIGGSVGKTGPSAIRPTTPDDMMEKVSASLKKLSPEDKKLAQVQRFCPIRNDPLGSMGVPVKLTIDGKSVFICCKGCVADAQANPVKTLVRIEEFKKKGSSSAAAQAPSLPPTPKLSPEDLAEIMANLDKLPSAEKKLVENQRVCPIQKNVLGSMGVPIKVDIGKGRSLFVCCKSCVAKVQKDPEEALRKIALIKAEKNP
jgi:multidrug efflux pump subunit AcrA (membrane-fusion protein)